MKNTLRMCVLNRFGHLPDPLDSMTDRNRSFPATPGQVLTLNIVHGEELLVVEFSEFVNGYDVGVPQSGDDLCFRSESFDKGTRGEGAGQDHFERDQPVETDLACFVDDAHASTSDDAEQLVIADPASPQHATGSGGGGSITGRRHQHRIRFFPVRLERRIQQATRAKPLRPLQIERATALGTSGCWS